MVNGTIPSLQEMYQIVHVNFLQTLSIFYHQSIIKIKNVTIE
jgi:hypothetical protein